MYVTIDNKTVEIKNMTNAFLKNALSYYIALCSSHNTNFTQIKERKAIRNALRLEAKLRRSARFKSIPLD
jgi:hypothetical protein